MFCCFCVYCWRLKHALTGEVDGKLGIAAHACILYKEYVYYVHIPESTWKVYRLDLKINSRLGNLKKIHHE